MYQLVITSMNSNQSDYIIIYHYAPIVKSLIYVIIYSLSPMIIIVIKTIIYI